MISPALRSADDSTADKCDRMRGIGTMHHKSHTERDEREKEVRIEEEKESEKTCVGTFEKGVGKSITRQSNDIIYSNTHTRTHIQ